MYVLQSVPVFFTTLANPLTMRWKAPHIQIGVDLCRKYKESAVVVNAVAAHHGDVEPETLVACIVQAADAISAARPGARRETLETYTNRLEAVGRYHQRIQRCG